MQREREIEVRVASPRAFRDQRGDFVVFWDLVLTIQHIFLLAFFREREKSGGDSLAVWSFGWDKRDL